MYTFRAKTSEGIMIKILAELLQNIVRTVCMCITTDGIHVCMMDSQRHILLNVFLDATRFNIYDFHTDDDIYLGLNVAHLFKMLRSIKKKDAVQLSIQKERPDKLLITTLPKGNTRIATSVIHIQTIQHVNLSLPEGYGRPIIVPAGDYQRTLKDMTNISKTLTLRIRDYSVVMECDAEGILSKEVIFGELDDASSEVYCEKFEIEYFVRILKIAGLGSMLRIYKGSTTIPLRISTHVGELGDISVYIKSNRQIEQDSSTS